MILSLSPLCGIHVLCSWTVSLLCPTQGWHTDALVVFSSSAHKLNLPAQELQTEAQGEVSPSSGPPASS